MATRWLFKTEPSMYSYQQLVKDKKTMWDGVANNLALKHLKDIKIPTLVVTGRVQARASTAASRWPSKQSVRMARA